MFPRCPSTHKAHVFTTHKAHVFTTHKAHVFTPHKAHVDMNDDTLLLHGFMGCAADWEPVLRGLDTGRAIDLPGHGATPLDCAHLSLDGWADWVAAQHAPVRQLVGYSLGGRLALRIAARHPAFCQQVVLVSAHPGLTDAIERADRAALDTTRAAQIRADFRGFLRRWYASPLFGLTTQQQARLIDTRAAQDPATVAAVIEAMSPGRAPASWDTVQRLSERPAGLRVVVGARDAKYAAVWAEHPGVLTLDAGHAVHIEAADALAALLD